MASPTPTRPFSLIVYRAAAGLAAPLAGPLLKARARRGKEDPERLGERLGHASAPRPDGPVVWMHGASVGESVSLLPLIAWLRTERPDIGLVVTSGTRASAEILARRLPAGAIHQYAPIDTPGAVGRFLAHWRPGLGVFAESELWPNLILAASSAGVRLALLSARMTEKSARAWRARPAAARAMLERFDLVLPQDAATATRLAALGADVAGRLNLKRAGAPLAFDAAELARLQRMIGEREVIVAVSTHAPEEAMIAAAAGRIASKPLAVIAPRHPTRGDEIAAMLAGRGVARRSRGEPITPETGVYLADTLNEIGVLLRLARFAVIGGGFSADIGGHNPMEAASLGVAVVSGRHVSNHAEVFAEMVAAGAATLAGDEMELTAQIAGLLADPAKRDAMAAASTAYAALQGQQMDAAQTLLRPLLPAR
ncbi:MAG TPA: glycosyltransferase N-terminal domain-containing protein [Caulobacteraceae bacterium]|nr:glycosyltransferase N-terminal domain-containing protein [Caulobacteraceae bacterium]